jgi:Protein of unknown function (DUF551)
MDWQPIETAPKEKNGRYLLLFGDGEAISQSTYIGFFNYDNDWQLFGAPYTKLQPTHWMPLPNPPSGAEKAKT